MALIHLDAGVIIGALDANDARDLLRTGVGRGRLARAFVDALTEQSDRD